MTTQDESQANRAAIESAATLKRLEKGIVRDLPTTFQPYFNQQARAWENLFPYERQYVLDVLIYLDQLSPDERSKLFAPILQLEEKMGVSRWNFSVQGQTLQDSSLLARSPYYQDWRRAEQEVFGQIERGMEPVRQQRAKGSPRRLILMIYPEFLPFEPNEVWKRWPQTGKTFRIDPGDTSGKRTSIESLFGPGEGADGPASGGLLDALIKRAKGPFADVWAFDAGTALSEFMLGAGLRPSVVSSATVLSFERLKAFREHYLDEVNTMNHNLSSADEIYSHIRKEDVSQFCPPEIKDRPIIREFIRALFMSGNGAPVSGNPFVQWGASEALRRARPSVLIGYFGTRDKPKPFTSVAVFVNQNIASPLPSEKDYPGSAIDASILSYYLWLSSTRYSEYENALTLCIAESVRVAYAVGPSHNPFQDQTQPVTVDQVSRVLGDWLSPPA